MVRSLGLRRGDLDPRNRIRLWAVSVMPQRSGLLWRAGKVDSPYRSPRLGETCWKCCTTVGQSLIVDN